MLRNATDSIAAFYQTNKERKSINRFVSTVSYRSIYTGGNSLKLIHFCKHFIEKHENRELRLVM